jgi:hypothetical protein
VRITPQIEDAVPTPPYSSARDYLRSPMKMLLEKDSFDDPGGVML